MKFNYLLLLVFFSVIVYAGIDFETGITGTTHLNGQGCVCHNINPDPTVQVWIEGPDTLAKGETAQYRIYLTGGPMVEGGFNVASRYSTLTAVDPGTQILANELTHNQPRLFTGDTVSWFFNYTATDSVNWDTLYSTANSVNGDGIPSELDHWDFGNNFPVRIIENVPVELISFSAYDNNGTIELNWITATEINNKGFEIERKVSETNDWTVIGFVSGKGTTTEKTNYSYTDSYSQDGKVYYRLKQVDFNGSYSFSNIVEISLSPDNFSLLQNYPNPFNPTTNIEYHLKVADQVTLKVYDVIGKEVASLVNEKQEAGKHIVNFNASGLASGIYIYTLRTDNYSSSKKLLLLK
jgi:hypothetical protein